MSRYIAYSLRSSSAISCAGRKARDLAAQLEPIEAARARHHHDAAVPSSLSACGMSIFDRLAAEQVFEIDLTHARREPLPLRERRERRQHASPFTPARTHSVATRRCASTEADGIAMIA